VSINNAGHPRFLDEAHWQSYQMLVNDWIARLGSKKILRVENARYGSDPIPTIHPRAIARDLQALRGISWGERNELLNERGFPGSTHLNRDVMGRFYGDANQDIEELLADYYEKIYGPAAEAMKAAFDFEINPAGEAFEKVWNADEGESWSSQAIVETSTGGRPLESQGPHAGNQHPGSHGILISAAFASGVMSSKPSFFLRWVKKAIFTNLPALRVW